MGKRLVMTLLVLLAFTAQALAQSTITGKVTDVTGEPLIGVNVMVKGTTQGAMTNLDGVYTLPNVSRGAVLIVSSIGYATVEIKVGDSTQINVTLNDDTTYLDDVVVVAYGTMKRKDLTGSMTEIKSDLLSVQNTTTVSRALEGSAPGLQVASVDGQPGWDMAIRLRGVSSTNAGSASALIVIDGVPQQPNNFDENPLSQLDPNDIASVSVLKDAASTALFGSRAGNGVVLITTKRGAEGKARISFEGRWGQNSIGNYNVNSIDTPAEYYEYAWKSIYNSYRYGVGGKGVPGVDAQGFYYTNVKTPNYSDQDARLFASQHLFDYVGSEVDFQMNVLDNNMAYDVPGAIYTKHTGSGTKSSSTMSGAYLVDPATGRINPNAKLLYNDDISEIMFQKAFRQEYNLSATGGTEKTHYYFSIGYQNDPSYAINSFYRRFSGRANVDSQILKWLKIGANVAYSNTKTRASAGKWGPRQIGSWAGNAMYNVKGSQPIVPVWQMNEKGERALDGNGERILNVNNLSYSPLGENHIARSTWSSDYLKITKLNLERQDIVTWTSRLFANFSFLQYFNLNLNFNMDEQTWRRNIYWNHVVGRAAPRGNLGIVTRQRRIINTQQILTFDRELGNHHVNAMLGHEYEDLSRDNLSFGSAYELIAGYPIPGNFIGRYVNMGGVSSASPGFGKDIYRTESYFSRLNYNFSEKYYLSASLRRDAASKFTKKNRWGTFWSLGSGWRFSKENFMQDLTWLDNSKLRLSYGVTGNANGLTNWYLNHKWWYAVASWQESTTGTGVPKTTSIRDNGLVVTNLTWENVHQFDLGLDFSVLKNRITGAIDYYNNLTVNSIFNQAVSPLASNGETTIAGNAAKVRNSGIEIELDADIVRSKDWTVSIGLNGTHYRTTLVAVPKDQIPYWDETIDLPKGTWTAQTEDMPQAGTSSHAGRGLFYLRGEGRDLFNIYMPKYAGIDENGLPLYWHRVTYYDVNKKDGKFEHGGRYSTYKIGDNVKTNVAEDASNYEHGSATPDWIGGINLSVRYKNFDFGIVSAYQFGGKFFSMEYSQHLFAGSKFGDSRIPVSKDLAGNTWTPENGNARFPMQWYPSDDAKGMYLDGSILPGRHNYTDMSLFSASYFRIKNITFGYTLPKSVCNMIGMSKFRAFVSADNLLIFSAQRGIDPTLSIIGGKEIDTYLYPQMRTVTCGVNIEF